MAARDRTTTDAEVALDALGVATRRRLVELLATGERSVGDLTTAMQDITPISQPAVSQHLKVLRDAGLVQVRAEGTSRLHALRQTGLDVVVAWATSVGDPLRSLGQPLDALATEVARGRRTRRQDAAAPGDRPGSRDETDLGSRDATDLGPDDRRRPA